MENKKTIARTSTKTGTAKKNMVDHSPLFLKENLLLMLVGIIVMAIGMIIMGGGKSLNPNEFNYKEVYSTTRITIAPIFIMAGLAIEIYAIFKKPKQRA